jgi:hypothetical protein
MHKIVNVINEIVVEYCLLMFWNVVPARAWEKQVAEWTDVDIETCQLY